jgi:hypothetical protein
MILIKILIGTWALLVGSGFCILLICGIIFEYPKGKSLKEMLSE